MRLPANDLVLRTDASDGDGPSHGGGSGIRQRPTDLWVRAKLTRKAKRAHRKPHKTVAPAPAREDTQATKPPRSREAEQRRECERSGTRGARHCTRTDDLSRSAMQQCDATGIIVIKSQRGRGEAAETIGHEHDGSNDTSDEARRRSRDKAGRGDQQEPSIRCGLQRHGLRHGHGRAARERKEGPGGHGQRGRAIREEETGGDKARLGRGQAGGSGCAGVRGEKRGREKRAQTGGERWTRISHDIREDERARATPIHPAQHAQDAQIDGCEIPSARSSVFFRSTERAGGRPDHTRLHEIARGCARPHEIARDCTGWCEIARDCTRPYETARDCVRLCEIVRDYRRYMSLPQRR